MIHFFDHPYPVLNLELEVRNRIKKAWSELLSSETQLRAFMDQSIKSSESYIAQYHAQGWFIANQDDDMYGLFLSQIAKADNDIFIFSYHDGYVFFSGHNPDTLVKHFAQIQQDMYSECMHILVDAHVSTCKLADEHTNIQ